MYNIRSYGAMILYRGRTEAYAQALRARVASDSVVLDIGAGPGILTLLALQAGARKAYAVEPDGVIQVAREAVAASGFAGRVEFMQALSTEISLPEKVDVIVSDLHGILPLFGASVASVLDARNRFLKPGGFLIPQQESLWVALASAPEFHQEAVGPWKNLPGMDYQLAWQQAVNTWEGTRFAAEALVTEPKVWAVLDYRQLESLNAKGGAQWTISRGCEAHGLCVWYDCMTAPGCGFTNSPTCSEEYAYKHAFFPWPEACQLEPGDHVSVEIRGDHAGQDYVWGWNTQIRGRDPRQPIKATFRQSDFLAAPLSRDYLRKSGSAFMPSPNMEAAIDGMILELFHTGINLEGISHRVADRFPERFPEWRKALTRVGEMSRRYSR